jgi:hypothetical protein
MKQITRVACTIVACTVAGTGMIFSAKASGKDVMNELYTTEFTKQTTWATSQTNYDSDYKTVKSYVSKVSLSTKYGGVFTIYEDKSGKPFIISGNSILYLIEYSSGKYGLRPIDEPVLRTEYTGSTIKFVSDAEYETLEANYKEAASLTSLSASEIAKNENAFASGKSVETNFIANGKYINKIKVYSVADYDYYEVPLSKICSALGVSYTVSDDTIKLSFVDYAGETVSYTLGIGDNKSSIEAMKIDGKTVLMHSIYQSGNDYYISSVMLSEVLGFDFDYNESNNAVSITVDPALEVVPISTNNDTVVLPTDFVSVSDAISSKALDTTGNLSDSATELYTAWKKSHTVSPSNSDTEASDSSSDSSSSSTSSSDTATNSTLETSNTSTKDSTSSSNSSSTPTKVETGDITYPDGEEPAEDDNEISEASGMAEDEIIASLDLTGVTEVPDFNNGDRRYLYNGEFVHKPDIVSEFDGYNVITYVAHLPSGQRFLALKIEMPAVDTSVTPEEAYQELCSWADPLDASSLDDKTSMDLLKHYPILCRANENVKQKGAMGRSDFDFSGSVLCYCGYNLPDGMTLYY